MDVVHFEMSIIAIMLKGKRMAWHTHKIRTHICRNQFHELSVHHLTWFGIALGLR